MLMPFDLDALLNLAIAALGGLAIGIERQWSGHADGPSARFAGLRTFAMLGLVAGLSGWLWTAGLEGPAVVLLGGVGALVVAAYVAASRHDVDGTTEVAAFVVLTSGALAGAGQPAVASGIIALTLILLVEKTSLHGLVRKVDRVEMRAGARFAVMATVILPLLPAGPFGPWGGMRPQQLWALVLFFSGLSFVGYLARRVAGRDKGYAIAGTLGGLLSSTSVTLTFARLSTAHPPLHRALSAGTLGANVVQFPRVLLATLVLAPPVAAALWPLLLAPALIGGLLVLRGVRGGESAGEPVSDTNPLQLRLALQMALFFQLVLYVVWAAADWFGQEGLIGSAAVLGLADVDALTVSMAQLSSRGTAADLAATAIGVGALSNLAVKIGIAGLIGRGPFRTFSVLGLLLMAGALAGALAWRWP
jgi:uncharacterized membrane protein (DUF4010 family)